MRPKVRLYTHEVLRITTTKLRAELGPSRWRTLSVIQVEADGLQATVQLVDLDAPSVHGGKARSMVCPGCGNPRVRTLGLVPSFGWCCRSCGGWKGAWRKRQQVAALREKAHGCERIADSSTPSEPCSHVSAQLDAAPYQEAGQASSSTR